MREIYRYFLRRLRGTSSEYQRHERWNTVPNIITIIGIGGVILYCCLFLTGSAVWMIPFLQVGILATDLLDGIVADKMNQHTRLGMMLDIFRDKLHVAAMFGNLILVDSASQGILIALVTVVCAECLISFLAFRGCEWNVHAVEKTRVLVLWVCGLVALIQIYWVGRAFVPLTILAGIMAVASVGAGFFYMWLAAKSWTRKEDRP